MSNITSALIIVLAINMMLFLGQFAVLEMNSEASTIYNCSGGMVGSFDQAGCSGDTYVLADGDPLTNLPDVEGSVSPETGAVYTDSYTGIKGWLVETTGLGYLLEILSAPSNLLKGLGLPTAFSFAIGFLWYGITLFLIVAFLFGRDV